MAKAKEPKNGDLEETMKSIAREVAKEWREELRQDTQNMLHSMTALNQAQAIAVQNHAAIQAEMRELQRENRERFARIEAILMDHSRILAEHGRKLEALPDAVRERMGFRVPDKV